jgi:hypothetical protein
MTDDEDRYVTISVTKKKPPKPDKPDKPEPPEEIIDPPDEIIEPPPVTATEGWSRVPLGPGGFISGVEIHPSGTMICRMDTSGAYRWDDEAGRWVMMVTTDSMPADVTDPGYGPCNGAYAIAIAPTDGNRIYMAWQHLAQFLVMRSDDAGLTFQHTGYVAGSTYEWNGNGVARGSNKRMAVDPNNADIVLLATMSGVKLSRDGGATWGVMDIPATTHPEWGYLVAIDHLGIMYAMVTGIGVYHSANDGDTWGLIADGGPTSSSQMTVTRNGNIFSVIDYHYANELWAPVHVYNGVKWITVQPDLAPHAILSGVTVDPADDSHIVVCDNEGNVSSSFDQGETWTGFAGHHYSCPEIGWLNDLYGGGGEWAMYGGSIQFAPDKNNTLVMGFGLGIAYCHPPADASKVEWRDTSLGLEQLCAKRLIKPKGNPNVIMAVMDQGVFTCDGVNYPETKGILPYFAAAWDCDWCPDDPQTVIVLINQGNGGPPDHSGVSRDGGQTWNVFSSNPYHRENHAGGMLACGTDPDNFIIVTGDFGTDTTQLHYTTDGGTSWTPAVMPEGIPPSGSTGWNPNYYYNRHTICGDRVLDGVFYGRNDNVGYVRSVDFGETWELMHSLVGGTFANARLLAVPGHAGHLLYASGWTGYTNFGGAMKRSTDGGATWTDTNTGEVYCIGFGKAADSATYPAIFIVGWVNNVYGIYRSDDELATWVQIGVYPMGCFDTPVDICGDLDVHGHCYLAVGASGIFKYTGGPP